jgi:metallo-beta-lactamase class B
LLRRLKGDVLLGSHASFFSLEDKHARLAIGDKGKERNPFIDPEGYRHFINLTERAFREQLQRER